MSEQTRLLELERRPQSEPAAAAPVAWEQLKLRRPERRQIVFAEIDVERLVEQVNPVRAIWALTGRPDLSGLAAGLRSEQGAAGRAAWDPRLLTAIWIWAYSEAISSAREIERQSQWRPELRWLCGMEVIKHPTLSDFRVAHHEALDEIFTQVLGLLSHEGLLDLEQVTVDGTRLRAQASTSSERRRGTIERHLEQAREAVKRLSREAEVESEAASQRRQAARQRAVREKVERLEQAWEQLQQIEAHKGKQAAQARVSESEPEARRQHESNGGFGTGYNGQLATDAKHKIGVGVELSAQAADGPQLEAALGDVERRLGQPPRQVLADAGYNSRANIAALEEAGIELVTAAPAPEKGSLSAAREAGIEPGYEAKFFV